MLEGALPLTTGWEAWGWALIHPAPHSHLVHRNLRATQATPVEPPSYRSWPPEGVQSSLKQGLS